jgi:LysM repeat protein
LARRPLTGFIVLNVIVTFTVATISILLLERFRSPSNSAKPTSPPLVVIVTATPDPNQPTPGPQIIIVTATPGRGGSNATVIAGGPTDSAVDNVPTLDPSLLPVNIGTLDVPTVTSTDESGCPTYVIRAGDTLGSIAPNFGVTVEEIMNANDLTDADVTRLQIGQELIMPVQGCGLPTPEPTETSTEVVLASVAVPTSTIAPTAAVTRLEVVQIISPGDITSEGIEIRNISGDVIDIGGWTLADSQGNVFTFPNYQMFEGRRVIIYTRAGTDTPFALFWGQSRPLWGQPDQTVTITDTDGEVQLSYTIPGTTN